MNSLYKLEVKGKVYRLLFEMNKNVKIKVKTPVGMSETVETGPILAQGSVEAAIASSSNIAVGVDEKFEESDKEVEYYGLDLNPFSFMDDIFRMAGNVFDAQFGNDLIEEMTKEKILDFNLEKSNFLIVGNRKERRKLKEQVTKTPLLLCGEKMRETKSLKYLGEYLCPDLQESIHETV